ncbi:3D domain-containing protein [Priestia sp. YIM B13551]|uniref:3D domain-containing protein n=1 Tax=Priestia sp. YIM B13551 TaxID=3366306 RepID=UPI00366D2658
MKQKITKGKVIQTCMITIAGLALASGVGFQFHENHDLNKDLNTLKENHNITVQELHAASEYAKKIEQRNHDLIAKTDKLSEEVSKLKEAKEDLRANNDALNDENDNLRQKIDKQKRELQESGEYPRPVKASSNSTAMSKSEKQNLESSSLKNSSSQKTKYGTSLPPKEVTTQEVKNSSSDNSVSRTMHGVASAYTLNEPGVTGITASGKRVRPGMVAMSSAIPLGTKVKITCTAYPSINGTYEVADRGGAIQGNRVDIYMESTNHAINFGKRDIKIEVLT